MYRIQITKTEDVETVTKREWVMGGTDGVPEGHSYGYTPQIGEIREVTIEVLNMTVETLAVASVVEAILENSDIG